MVKKTNKQTIVLRHKKKNEIFSPVTTQMDLEGIMLSEISQTGKDGYIPYDYTYMWNLKKKKKQAKKNVKRLIDTENK